MHALKKCIYVFSLLLVWAANCKVYGQSAAKTYFHQEIGLLADVPQPLDLPQAVSAVKISPLNTHQGQVILRIGSDSITLSFEAMDHEEFPSNFGILRYPTAQLIFESSVSAALKIEYFYTPLTQDDKHVLASKHKFEDCSKPETIAQSNWRDGLADPKTGRTATTVKHCIVHHAASSNAHTDYTYVVRNIYLLHTESNGWDDIGYNFLIAPDGTVFSGRDPLGVADEDNIQGAHFCSKNGGTMGVCLIGDYTQLAPKDSMIDALVQLLAWKLNKEGIGAFDQNPHPNSNSDALDAVAMHRQGCATVCPGDSVALQIPSIRTRVQNLLDQCGNVGITEESAQRVQIFPNPNTGSFTLSGIPGQAELLIFDHMGRKIMHQNGVESYLHFQSYTAGTYTLVIRTEEHSIQHLRFLVY